MLAISVPNYMIGGLHCRALHNELVGSGRMTNREFHDAILHQNTLAKR